MTLDRKNDEENISADIEKELQNKSTSSEETSKDMNAVLLPSSIIETDLTESVEFISEENEILNETGSVENYEDIESESVQETSLANEKAVKEASTNKPDDEVSLGSQTIEKEVTELAKNILPINETQNITKKSVTQEEEVLFEETVSCKDETVERNTKSAEEIIAENLSTTEKELAFEKTSFDEETAIIENSSVPVKKGTAFVSSLATKEQIISDETKVMTDEQICEEEKVSEGTKESTSVDEITVEAIGTVESLVDVGEKSKIDESVVAKETPEFENRVNSDKMSVENDQTGKMLTESVVEETVVPMQTKLAENINIMPIKTVDFETSSPLNETFVASDELSEGEDPRAFVTTKPPKTRLTVNIQSREPDPDGKVKENLLK